MVGPSYAISTSQKWVLFYFIKNQGSTANFENLADNMCLSNIMDFNTGNFRQELIQLIEYKLINSTHIGTAVVFGSTLEGRLYVKQHILGPLILAKNKNELNKIMIYLRSHPNRQLASELESIINEREQTTFLSKISTTAVNNIVQFLEIIDKIKEMVPTT